MVGECEKEDNILSYIQAIVRIEVPQAIFKICNRKGITKNVHEIVYRQSVSIVGGIESQRTWKQINCEMIVEVEIVLLNCM